jgi:hypothetical protein
LTTSPLRALRSDAFGLLRGVARSVSAGLARTSFGFGRLQFIALAAIVAPIFAWLGRALPTIPWLSSDSASYLEFSPVRPHGYSLFLATYRLAFADLAHLPSVQLSLYLAAVLLLATAVGRRTKSFAAAATTLLLVCGLTDTGVFPWVLSDSLYAAALISGTACFLLYIENLRASFLLLASAGLGVALVFRPIGLALLPGFFIAVAAHAIWWRRNLASTAAQSTLPIAVLYCVAAASQLLHNGRFALGNWGGMDILGKVPLLTQPLPASSRLASLNWIVDESQLVRDKLRLVDNPFLEALIAFQYYEYLRWFEIVPELERTWPAWRDGDDHRRGQLAAEVVEAYVAEDPIGYLRRTAVDFLGLWAMPRWLTGEEQRAATIKVERLGKLPFLSSFAETAEGKLDYYKIVSGPRGSALVFTFRAVVIAFWSLTIGYIALVANPHRRKALRMAPDILFMVLVLHAVYLGTAIMEGAHDRYIMPTWPLLVAAPMLALGLMLRHRSRDHECGLPEGVDESGSGHHLRR